MINTIFMINVVLFKLQDPNILENFLSTTML